MKANWPFYLAVGIDLITLFVTASNLFLMSSSVQGLGGTTVPMDDGLTTIGKLFNWIIPLVLLLVIGLGFWLRSNGKVLAANILVWVPAFPMLVGILIWGGLAMLFILGGK